MISFRKMRRFFAPCPWRIRSANARRRASAPISFFRKPYLLPAGAEQAPHVLERQCMSIHPEIREFTSSDFHFLAGLQEPVCLSMFVPHAGGEQAALAHSQPALKDLLRRAEDALRARGVQSAEIHEWLAPLERLLASNLWQGTEQTVAFFRTRHDLHSFLVPLRIASRVIVGDRLFLKPLIRSLLRRRRYYVLAISDNAARLFHCRDAECTEVRSGHLPGSLEEALSARDFSPRLQGHTSKASARKVLTYHGHSAPIEDIHENRRLYCRKIDTALHGLIRQSNEPLVLACLKELFVEFQQINTYPHLVSEPVAGNPDRLDPSELHEMAQKIVDSEVQKQIAQAVAEYTELQGTDRATSNAEAILEAADNGRIRIVIVAEDAEMWGTLDRSTGATRLAIGTQSPEHEEFLNRIATQTVKHGGIAFTLPLASMPSGKPMAALFRY